LAEAKRVEPVDNLLHGGPHCLWAAQANLGDRGDYINFSCGCHEWSLRRPLTLDLVAQAEHQIPRSLDRHSIAVTGAGKSSTPRYRTSSAWHYCRPSSSAMRTSSAPISTR
jgi:hypothetical protein